MRVSITAPEWQTCASAIMPLPSLAALLAGLAAVGAASNSSEMAWPLPLWYTEDMGAVRQCVLDVRKEGNCTVTFRLDAVWACANAYFDDIRDLASYCHSRCSTSPGEECKRLWASGGRLFLNEYFTLLYSTTVSIYCMKFKIQSNVCTVSAAVKHHALGGRIARTTQSCACCERLKSSKLARSGGAHGGRLGGGLWLLTLRHRAADRLIVPSWRVSQTNVPKVPSWRVSQTNVPKAKA